MPRYHFNVHDGVNIPDRTGTELSDLREARLEAVRLAGALLKDQPMQVALGEDWRMEVTDATGLVLFNLHLFMADAAAVSGGSLGRSP